MTSYPGVMYLMHRNHWRNTMLLSSLVIITLFAVKTRTCYMLSRQRRKIALVDSLTKSDHIQEDNSLPFKQTRGYLLQSNESRVGRTTVEYCTILCTTQSVTLLVAIGSESDNQIVRVSRNACSHRVSCLLEL